MRCSSHAFVNNSTAHESAFLSWCVACAQVNDMNYLNALWFISTSITPVAHLAAFLFCYSWKGRSSKG